MVPILGIPDTAVAELAHVDAWPAVGVQAHVRHEELSLFSFFFNLEEEESGVALGPEPLLVLPDESDNLRLLPCE